MKDKEWEKIKAGAQKYDDDERAWVVSNPNGQWIRPSGEATLNLLVAGAMTEKEAKAVAEATGDSWVPMKLAEAFRTDWEDRVSDSSKLTVGFRLSRRL